MSSQHDKESKKATLPAMSSQTQGAGAPEQIDARVSSQLAQDIVDLRAVVEDIKTAFGSFVEELNKTNQQRSSRAIAEQRAPRPDKGSGTRTPKAATQPDKHSSTQPLQLITFRDRVRDKIDPYSPEAMKKLCNLFLRNLIKRVSSNKLCFDKSSKLMSLENDGVVMTIEADLDKSKSRGILGFCSPENSSNTAMSIDTFKQKVEARWQSALEIRKGEELILSGKGTGWRAFILKYLFFNDRGFPESIEIEPRSNDRTDRLEYLIGSDWAPVKIW